MIITLCGSNKFKDGIKNIGKYLIKDGHYVHMPAEFTSDIKEDTDTFYQIQKGLLLGHFRKIDQADVVVICNFEGYIGNSTTMELAYAYAHNKFIIALTKSKEMAHNVCISQYCDTREYHVTYVQDILDIIEELSK